MQVAVRGCPCQVRTPTMAQGREQAPLQAGGGRSRGERPLQEEEEPFWEPPVLPKALW